MKQVEKIDDKNIWNKQIMAAKSTFPQSWQWGDILLSEGKELERLAVKENGVVLLAAQVVYADLPFGWKYAFCPQGPVGQNYSESLLALKEYLEKQGVIFLRLEPMESDVVGLIKTVDINPRATLILNLQKNQEELLTGMHPKTRYNIRLAQKKNLQIKEEKNLRIFLELMKKTGSRDKFRLHETRHYEAILNSEFSRQLTICSEKTPIATAVFVGFGDTFTYLFGASDHEYRQLMAPYLLQWEAIALGQTQGYKFYDFFGVAPKINTDGEYEFDPKHQYAGVSRFKHGFGGEYYEAPGTFDLVINNFKYNLYSWLRKLRRMV